MKFIVFMIAMLGTAVLILYSGLAFPTMVALTLFILAIGADFLTTHLCYRKKGREGNPVMAVLHKRIGLRNSFLVMGGLWTVIIITRFMPATEGVQTAISLVYWFVPANNLWVLRRLGKKNMQVEGGN